MENFVLYHEIMKQDGMIMYKGRKKGTISYVAVSCIDKKQRVKVTNHVRLIYELEHEHVSRFMEWYETSNHLWLVTELCVGGSLEKMLLEDGVWPEDCIREFAIQLIYGINHLHSRGILFVLWNPNKIILDGEGRLKFFDFSDSRKIDEDNEELARKFFSGLNIDSREVEDLFDYSKPTFYTAPELLEGSPVQFSTDIWGLGCLMFRMLTGQVPFTGKDDKELYQNILSAPLIIPKTIKFKSQSTKVSSGLCDLLERMLCRNSNKRLNLQEIIHHPFWNGELMKANDFLSVTDDQHNHQQISYQQTSSIGLPRTPHSRKQDHKNDAVDKNGNDDDDEDDDDDETNTIDDLSFTLHIAGRQARNNTNNNNATMDKAQENLEGIDEDNDDDDEEMEKTAINADDNALLIDNDEFIESILSTTQSTNSTNSTSTHQNPPSMSTQNSKKALDEYWKMLKDSRLKYDSKLLPVPPVLSGKWKTMHNTERQKHLKQLETSLRQSERGPPTQRRLHLLNYSAVVSLALSDNAQYLIESVSSSNTTTAGGGLMLELTRQAKSSTNQDLVIRTCQLIAITVYNSVTNQVSVVHELLLPLADMLRDNFRQTWRIKHACAVALGEVLIKCAANETGSQGQQAQIPGLTLALTLMLKCLQKSDEIPVNLISARLFNHLFTFHPTASLTQATLSQECFNQLFSLYRHSNTSKTTTTTTTTTNSGDALKVVVACALAAMTRADKSGALLDKFVNSSLNGGSGQGPLSNISSSLLLDGAITNMALPIQESVLEMIARILLAQKNKKKQHSTTNYNATNNNNSNSSLANVTNVFSRLLDCPTPEIRARLLLVLLLISRNDLRSLRVVFIDTKMQAHLEREFRRVQHRHHQQQQESSSNSPNTSSSVHADTVGGNSSEPLPRVLHSWAQFLAHLGLPAILSESLDALAAVQGRKHPSPAQLRALRANLPLLEVVASLLVSPTLRNALILTSDSSLSSLMSHLGRLMGFLVCVEEGEVNLGLLSTTNADSVPATPSVSSFMTHVLMMSEGAITGAPIYEVVTHIMDPLAHLATITANPDARIISLKLCSDIINKVTNQLKENIQNPSNDQLLSNIQSIVESRFLLAPSPTTTNQIPEVENSAVIGQSVAQKFLTDRRDLCAVNYMRLMRLYINDLCPLLSNNNNNNLGEQHQQQRVLKMMCGEGEARLEFGHLLIELILDHQHRICGAAIQEAFSIIQIIAQLDLDIVRDWMQHAELMGCLRDTYMELGILYSREMTETAPTNKESARQMQPQNLVVTEVIQNVTDSLSCMAKMISDVVKEALQTRKQISSNKESESSSPDKQLVQRANQLTTDAERLLSVGRPITDCVLSLARVISGELNSLNRGTTNNNDQHQHLGDASVKLLNQIVSLYGGQQIRHGLDEQCVRLLGEAVLNLSRNNSTSSNGHNSSGSVHRHQRTLLRILKRLLASGKPTNETEVIFNDLIGQMQQNSIIEKDAICAGLLEEILKLFNNKQNYHK